MKKFKAIGKKILKAILFAWSVFFVLVVITMLITGQTVTVVVPLTFLAIGVVPLIFLYKTDDKEERKRLKSERKEKRQRLKSERNEERQRLKSERNEKKEVKAKQKKEKNKTTEDELMELNFAISKSYKFGQFLKDGFYIDDVNKKVSVSINKQLRIYNYTDIGAYELNEDGNTIAKGKGLATAVGGLTFGLLGAMVGATGKRKSESTCSSLIVRIMVNNLQNPQIVIPFLSSETKKSSYFYKTAFEEAKDLIATLSYIENCGSESK